MIIAIIISFILATIISLLWVRGIDRAIQYEQEHPDADKNAGWLDWDEQLNREMEEWDATLMDGLEDEPEWENDNDNLGETNEVEEPTTDEPELPFVDTTMPNVEFQGSHRVTLTMNGSETAPIIFTPEMLREIKQRENKAWRRYNDDNQSR